MKRLQILYNIHATKITIIMMLLALLLYLSDRSYLVMAPAIPKGQVIYNSDFRLETGVIIAGKLTPNQLEEIDKEIPVVEEVLLPLNINIDASDIQSLYASAKSKNNDTIGYIYIPDSKINYPVMYRDTKNNYYLTHDSLGNYNAKGAIYLEDMCNGIWSEINLIHGHSVWGNDMFGQLLSYKTQSWADSHPYIYIYDGETTRVYAVFAVCVVNGGTEKVPLGFLDESTRESYYGSAISRSKVTASDLVDNKDVIILNTCSYESDNFRLLVYATRIEPEYDENGLIELNTTR